MQGKITHWLLGSLLSLVLFVAGLYTGRLNTLEQDVSGLMDVNRKHEARIAVTERAAEQAAVDFRYIRARIDTLEKR